MFGVVSRDRVLGDSESTLHEGIVPIGKGGEHRDILNLLRARKAGVWRKSAKMCDQTEGCTRTYCACLKGYLYPSTRATHPE